MSLSRQNLFFFFVSLLAGIALYWVSFHGEPIWDDLSYLFSDPDLKNPEFSHLHVWKNYSWPLNTSLTKIFIDLFGKNYLSYHILNFSLHFLNSLLVYKIAQELKFKWPKLGFLLFFLHPACVISVAWMIQFKTLICFFFAFSSLFLFLRNQRDLKVLSFSWVLFFLSVTAKSASIGFPVFFFFLLHKKDRKGYLSLVPFLLISAWSGHRLLTSPYTLIGIERAESIKENLKKLPERKVVQTEEKKKEKKEENKKIVEIPKSETPKVIQKKVAESSPFGERFQLINKTLHYYFWQTIIPLHNVPIRGLNHEDTKAEDYIHLLFIILLVLIFWKKKALAYFLTAHFLLIPFLGFIVAPYMSVTWVSDQHLYLVLPIMLAFWFSMLENLSFKYVTHLLGILIAFFSFKTWKTVSYYENQETFFKASLDYNPFNVPISYNLAYAYVTTGRVKEATMVLERIEFFAEEDPKIKKSPYYPHVIILLLYLKKGNGL